MEPPKIPLPKSWPILVQSAILYTISLARFVAIRTRSWAANSSNERVRQRVEIDRLQAALAEREERERIKDTRMARLEPHRRPHYPPTERLAILELRAAQGWSQAETADIFQVTAATIASWCQRLDEEGPRALVRTPVPVNRFPEFVAHIVRLLRFVCPWMGTRRIAGFLARAGLHLGRTTVQRMLAEPPRRARGGESKPECHHTARAPNDVWHVDLTAVPIGHGFWVPWLPRSLRQAWPFCWWLGVVVDGFSRRIVGHAVFDGQPNSADVRAMIDEATSREEVRARSLICDRGPQFDCSGFRAWATRLGIALRYAAIGQHGSLAVVERVIGTLKREGFRRILVPYRIAEMQDEVALLVHWHNEYRPHQSLNGATPNEVYAKRRPANRNPRIEPRPRWPRPSPCAAPQTLVAGRPGATCELQVEFLEGRRHLPIVTLNRAA